MLTTYCENVTISTKLTVDKIRGLLHDSFGVPIFRTSNVLYFNLPLTEAFTSIEISEDNMLIECPAFGISAGYAKMDEANIIATIHQYKLAYERYFDEGVTEELTLLMIANLANYKGMNIKVTPYRVGSYLVYFNKAFRLIDTYNASIINNKLNALLDK